MKRSLRDLARNIFPKHHVKRRISPAGSSIEIMEQRLFLSGSVLASVVHGNLTIRGNAAANSIVVDQAGLTAGQVRVSGAAGTAINNQNAPVILSGITGGVSVRMGAGVDSVTLTNLSLPGNVTIDD